MAVFVCAQKSHIQPVAKVRNAVAFTSEEGNGVLGREHQPQIGVALVLIEIVAAAGKKPNTVQTFPVFVAQSLSIFSMFALRSREHLREMRPGLSPGLWPYRRS